MTLIKKSLGLGLLAVLIAVAVIGAVQNHLAKPEQISDFRLGTEVDFLPTDEGLAIGQTAPDFELATLGGETVRLSDYRGQKVFLNFWTSWCPPCRAEMPIMQTYFEEEADENNVEIIAVNLTSQDNGIREVREFVEEFELEFLIPLDAGGDVGRTYQAITIPTSYMIDTEGRVQNKVMGPMDEEMMQELIDKLN